MTNQEIAQTIIEQMGGLGKIRAMVSASQFVCIGSDGDHGPGVQFSFKGCRKANKCRVTLNGDDTYRFELYKFNRKTFDCPQVFEIDGAYWDMLKPVFEEETGLRLSL